MVAANARLIFLLGAILLIQVHLGYSIKLNSDGGYEIVVALDESTPIPNIGAASYIDNIKTSLRAFSIKLWVTTKTHFYLKSVDIIVPGHWNVSNAAIATTQSFQNSDIRLSPNVTYPHTENPNVCGRPGNFIQLPSSFFNTTHTGPYGLHWKSLLHIWAMYRFGVHPEHGYIGDSKFPYATMDTKSQQWTVTGCSNEPIQGKFINRENSDNATCEEADDLSNNCRFEASATGQNASTSLMHFHWIESVTDFCDEANHNAVAQNMQNSLCDHKSVWEIIRDSPDYVAVTSPKDESVPAVTFRTFKLSTAPRFYILLDQGRIQGSFAIAQNIPRALSSLLIDNGLKNTVASFGALPGNENSPVIDLVQWSELGANENAFLEALGSLRNDGPLERDFSRALVTVANKIKATNHPRGTVVLLIKYGADVRQFGDYLPEPEVIQALNEGNIILNSIELNFPNHTGYAHLARVARETGGTYVSLSSYGQAETSIRNVLNYVKRTLLTEYTDLRKTWKILRKETFALDSIIPVASAHFQGPLQIFVSTSNPDLSYANFSVTVTTGTTTRSAKLLRNINFQLTKSMDWNEEGSKFTYKLEIPQFQYAGTSHINLRLLCGTGSLTCRSGIIARAQFTGQSQVKIELSTSLENDRADLSSGQPISIFAKVTKNDKPVQDAIVIATLTEVMSLRTTRVRLLDDGKLAPDALEGDGTYSAYFAPEYDGQFRLSVSVEGNPPTWSSMRATIPRNLSESLFTRLLPIDQDDMGCGVMSCDSETVDGNVTQTLEQSSTFSVVNAILYRPSPTKILSLMVRDGPALGQISFYWQSPKIPGRFFSVTSYELKSSTSLEQLIKNFENQSEVPVPPNFRPKPPTSFETISTERPTSTTYYAIRSIYRGKPSSISNIVSKIMTDSSTTPLPTASTTSGTTGEPTTTSDTTGEPTTTSNTTGEPTTTLGTTEELTTTSNTTGEPTTTLGTTGEPTTTSNTTGEPTTTLGTTGEPTTTSNTTEEPTTTLGTTGEPTSTSGTTEETDPPGPPSTDPSQNNASKFKTINSIIALHLVVAMLCIIFIQ